MRKEETQLFLPRRTLLALLAISITVGLVSAHVSQKPDLGHDRDRGRAILDIIKDDLKENYYDPTFHGMDVNARFKAAKEKINSATSNGQIFSIIAQVLIDLNDSHTFFIPPDRVVDTDYGWEMQMIGDKCYVVDVTPGSDAQSKGVRIGDEVWSIDGFEPTRENLWKIRYSYYTLKPRAGMRLVLRNPSGSEREVEVMARIVKGRERILLAGQKKLFEASRFSELKNDLIIWKLPSFEVSPKEIDDSMARVMRFKSLILDLRGNSGGYEDALLRLTGYFFDHDLKLGDAQRRKGTKVLLAKTRSENIFKGKLVVLVDSSSASASELFARVIQLEKRGTIIGDRSAGAVMRSKLYGEADVIGAFGDEGANIRITPFAVSITEANLLMTDGKSLEGVGVIPDESLAPKGSDLVTGRDVVLARAAADCGITLEPEDAGALFPALRLKLEEPAEKNKKDKNDKKKVP
jgi:carboxyl-terminal processing protease